MATFRRTSWCSSSRSCRSRNWRSADALFDIERETVRVADVAARHGRIFLDHGAACGQQRRLGGLQVGHQKVEHRAVLGSALDEQAKRAGLEAGHRIAIKKFF